MNRADFQRLAELRIEEARVLLDNGYYSGAYYLAGYAIECALKACIAKQIKEFDFPDKKLANKIYTHKLEDLLEPAQLKVLLDIEIRSTQGFGANWAVVKDWSEESRYDPPISETRARNLYEAITDPTNGVLTWLKNYW